MGNGGLDQLLRQVRRAALDGGDEPGDRELLQDYTRSGDPSALETLIRRHGPLVLGVCRRVLGNEQDAEDAFQAAFLVLAKKAASLKRQSSVASWLHTVALRLALRARAESARRRACTLPSGLAGGSDPL